MFILNKYLIPALLQERIVYRFPQGVYNDMKILIVHKCIDVCQVEAIPELGSEFCYKVDWAHPRNNACFPTLYKSYTTLITHIKEAIKFLKNRGEGYRRGGSEMNKNMYRVSDVEFRSSPDAIDELAFTVGILRPSGFVREDYDRIKEAIENIGETNKSYYVIGRGNGKTGMCYDYLGGFTTTSTYTWRNEYEKERDKFDIKDVIFNDPATIVLWVDGTKTVVKAENEPFDPEKGLAMAIAKKALGNKYDYYDIFKKYVGRYEKKQKKGGK